MKTPTIQLVPLRNAISSDNFTTLDLIVRIVPPPSEIALERPQLNLGLVIDRSGSMQGQKIEYARQAACYAVQQLLPSDRLSVTIYDDQIDVLVPSTLIEDKNQIIRRIQSITPRNSTNLHGGWLEGGTQVSRYLQPSQLNRVILLSDGLANVGQTNPDLIASDVRGLSQHGVSTTTMGIGDDYNEDLMTAMANSGDGSYYYITSPAQLSEIFNTELLGIMATVGEKVSLGIELASGVMLVDVFNHLDQTNTGRYKLPNLIIGNPVEVGIRLKIPPMTQESPLCQFRLAWNVSDQRERQSIRESLQLPVVSSAQLTDFPVNEEVTQLIALLLSARAKEEVVRNLDRQDYTAAKASLSLARQQVASAPSSATMSQESKDLDFLEEQLDSGDYKRMRKEASYQSHLQYYSRSHQRPMSIDLSGLKWIKNVTDPRPEVKWAYHSDAMTQYPDIFHADWSQKTFGLNWPNGGEENAKKTQAGDLILLKQNNCITHLVQFIDNHVNIDSRNSDYTPYRMVKIIWITPNWNNPPNVKTIFQCDLELSGGNVANLENFKVFQEYWNQGRGGLTDFQEHIRQVLKLN